MKHPLALLALAVAGSAAATEATSPRAQAWWNDIRQIADDRNEGRQTGSQGYRRAARYVISRFEALGLQPSGENGGFEQSVAFEQQVVDQGASAAVLTGTGVPDRRLSVGEDMIVSAGGAARPDRVDAPLVFVGYGLHVPQRGWDDFKGVDVKGKVAVVISGGPADLPGPDKASARAERARFLAAAGAVGLITLTTPRQVEIPWTRARLLARGPGMYLADRALRETPDGLFLASVDPDRAQLLFDASGRRFSDLAALADASRPVPVFDLGVRLKAQVVARRSRLTSPNLVARLQGADPTLKAQYVVLSAHLDHLGVGAPIAGRSVYNGAMDDASGVASVLDIAQRLRAGPPPRRSVLFVIVTAEEKGLLGSHYFASRPTVPAGSVVADLNFDMPLPLWTLKTVLVQGEGESSLGEVARAVAAQQDLALTPDPLPDRNSFTRTDQYSFVKAGVPSLAFKFGFAKGTPEFQIEHDWRANRYHSPQDDLDQPGVLADEAVRLDDYVAAIARAVADDPDKPRWLPTSAFAHLAGGS
jgi:Zn-dependent M28 family amino/carboxypeptidase